MPGEEVWLIGEQRTNGERKYYISNLPPETPANTPDRRHQGALDLRAGASATQGGTRPRPLRKTVMDRSALPRSHDNDRLMPSCNPAGSKLASLEMV